MPLDQRKILLRPIHPLRSKLPAVDHHPAYPAAIFQYLTLDISREIYPTLNIERLQRGTRGGDQQLGALIATGELDAIIFFADPEANYSNDVDLIALTRLAILHDTPIVCSPAAADLVMLSFN